MSDFLNKLKSLSPEEIEATKQRANQDEEFASRFKSEVEKLDVADKQVAEQLMFGTQVNEGAIPTGQRTAASRETAEKESNVGQMAAQAAGVVAETLEDAAVGVGQAIPGINHVGAAIGAGVDKLMGSEKSFSELKEENLEYRMRDKAMRAERSPIASGVGRGVGEVAISGLAAGGAVKALKATGNAARWTGIGSDVVTETVQRFSDSETKTFEALTSSAQNAILLTAAGHGLGHVVGAAFEGISNSVQKAYANTIKGRGIKSVVKATDAFVESTNNRITRDKYTYHLSKLEGVEEAVKSGNPRKAQNIIESGFYAASREKEVAIRQIEDMVGDRFGLSAQDVQITTRKITEPLDNLIMDAMYRPASLSDDLLTKVETLKGNIETLFKLEAKDPKTGEILQSIPNLRVSDIDAKLAQLDNLFKANKETFETLRNAGKNIDPDNMVGRLRKARNIVRDSFLEGADPEVALKMGGLKQLDESLEVLHHAKNVADSEKAIMREIEEGRITRALVQSIRDQAKVISAVGIGSSIAAGYTGADYTTAATVGIGAAVATTLAYSPAVIGKTYEALQKGSSVDKKLAELAGLGKYYVSGSGSKSALYGSLMTKFANAISNPDENVENYVGAMKSTQALHKFPLQRTTVDLMAKKDQVLDILKVTDMSLYNSLKTAIQEGEDVAPIMEQVAKSKAAKEVVLDGVGWDGVTYDPATRQQLEEMVASQPLIPAGQKIRMIGALRENGVIPNMEEVKKRVPKKYKAKGNRRPY